MFSETKIKEEVILSPLNGKLINIEEVPDPVFSQKILGEGTAIEPTDGTLVSPVDGTIIHLFPTNHAIGIRSKYGLEMLIHIGLDTVAMQGEGFHAYVKEGEVVKAGQPLIDFALDIIRKKAKSVITPIVFTNSQQIEELAGKASCGDIHVGTPIWKIKIKA